MPHPALSDPRTGTLNWGGILFIFAIGLVAAFHLFKLSPALPLMRQELGFSLATGGRLFSIINLVGMLAGVLIGGMADTIGHRRALLAAMALVCVTSFWASVASDPDALLWIRLLEGVGFVILVVAAPSLMAEQSAPNERRIALSVWACYLPAGAVIVMLTAPLLLEDYGWRALWRFTGWLSLAAIPLMLWMFRGGLRPHPRRRPPVNLMASVKAVISRPVTWLLMLSFAVFAAANVAVLAWLPTYLQEEVGMSAYRAGLFTAVPATGNVLGNLIAAYMLSRGLPARNVTLISALAMAVCAVGMLWLPLPNLSRYFFCVAYSTIAGLWPAALFNLGASTVAEQHRGSMNGLLTNGSNLGIFIGPMLTGVAVHSSGAWESANWLILPAVLAGAVIAPLLRPRPTKQDYFIQ